ncbi:hypothetical protein [Sediminimonas sp.]|uniref:hypothetical protein n=1 Tax=Sediminimonas sp. TaxID=2823379 RepID=UPI0025E8DD4C|nr:hypothetical protein [Sediminimonas sp.]
MKRDELKQSPAIVAGALALAAGVFCLVYALLLDGPTPMRQALMCGALVLMAFDVLIGTAAMRGPRRPDNPVLLVHAFYIGWAFMAAAVLIAWQGPAHAPALILQWAGGGLLIGLIVALLPHRQALVHLPGVDDPARRITRDRRGRMLFFGWPFLSVLLLAGPLLDKPGAGADLRSLALPLVIVPFLLSPVRGEVGFWSPLARRLRVIAVAIIAVALFLV